MEKLPFSQLERGTLLIATPEIDRGLFFRSVLLVCEHSAGGSFAIIINKPLGMEIPHQLVDPETNKNPHVRMLTGGPVQTNQMMLLHTDSSIPDETLPLCENVYLGGDLSFLQERIADEEGPSIRLCFGYTGWGPGQLEEEFLEGQWLLHPASEELIFHTQPDDLWAVLLRKLGGKYASLSTIPKDLSLN